MPDTPVTAERDVSAEAPSWDDVPIAIVVTDAGGEIAWCNAAGRRALAGLPPPESPQDRAAPDGTVWAWSPAPSSRCDGRVYVAYDVTARRARELAAHAHTRRYADLLASTRDALVTIDRRGVIEEVNAATERMFGWSADDLRGQKVNILMPEPYASEHDGYIASYQRTGQGAAIGRIRTVAARRRSGEIFPIELSVTEVVLDGQVRYTAFIRDITESVRLQEKAVDHERLAAIGTTSAAFAHEIGNPLNAMGMHAQLLERRLARAGHLDDSVRPSLDALTGEIKRLSRLLDEFRAVARRPRLSVLPTDVNTLLRSIIAAVQPRLDARNVSARCEMQPGVRASLVDPERIRQVLLNLINNALDAMSDGGKLTLRSMASDEQIRIEVIDTGPGVADGIDPFEAFVTTKPDGTGLGLPVARQIAGAHGGSLYHVPGDEGGARFVLTLPRRGR